MYSPCILTSHRYACPHLNLNVIATLIFPIWLYSLCFSSILLYSLSPSPILLYSLCLPIQAYCIRYIGRINFTVYSLWLFLKSYYTFAIKYPFFDRIICYVCPTDLTLFAMTVSQILLYLLFLHPIIMYSLCLRRQPDCIHYWLFIPMQSLWLVSTTSEPNSNFMEFAMPAHSPILQYSSCLLTHQSYCIHYVCPSLI